MKAIVIVVKNAQELANRDGSPVIDFLGKLSPSLLENKVLDVLRGKLAESLAKEGVDASVSVVVREPTPPNTEAIVRETGGSLRAGIVAAGIAGAIAMILLARK